MKYLIILCVLLASCASIQYEGFSYTRVGNQELIDVTIEYERHADGTIIMKSHLGHQISEKELQGIIDQMVSDALRFYGILL